MNVNQIAELLRLIQSHAKHMDTVIVSKALAAWLDRQVMLEGVDLNHIDELLQRSPMSLAAWRKEVSKLVKAHGGFVPLMRAKQTTRSLADFNIDVDADEVWEVFKLKSPKLCGLLANTSRGWYFFSPKGECLGSHKKLKKLTEDHRIVLLPPAVSPVMQSITDLRRVVDANSRVGVFLETAIDALFWDAEEGQYTENKEFDQGTIETIHEAALTMLK
jgi:hypothetical protein